MDTHNLNGEEFGVIFMYLMHVMSLVKLFFEMTVDKGMKVSLRGQLHELEIFCK